MKAIAAKLFTKFLLTILRKYRNVLQLPNEIEQSKPSIEEPPPALPCPWSIIFIEPIGEGNAADYEEGSNDDHCANQNAVEPREHLLLERLLPRF